MADGLANLSFCDKVNYKIYLTPEISQCLVYNPFPLTFISKLGVVVPVIPGFRKWGQAREFKVSLGYLVRCCGR